MLVRVSKYLVDFLSYITHICCGFPPGTQNIQDLRKESASFKYQEVVLRWGVCAHTGSELLSMFTLERLITHHLNGFTTHLSEWIRFLQRLTEV